ncbi:hypothetical protein ADIS_3988 [Lunatimonas lonarensis]|uniref:DUF4293 domain-containing protein n=1 Tax=Lunatimonas lonarensis TaxID=1232681 RepID=R7ZNC1_9BACT|nr:DUF4293 domain-containing protein [Lunatimonas lonarensis]EON75585.1 hypothetical protein ADIS_3988 [Lunatimonas lonarensis]
MIQRIQSVFLLLVAIAMFSLPFLSIWVQVNPAQTEQLKLTAWSFEKTSISSGEIIEANNHYLIGILAIIAGAIAIYSLIQFKNRTRQMFLNMINSLVMGIALGATVFLSYRANDAFNPQATGAYIIGFYTIIFGLIMNMLANRFIRKDEMLVRSIDRIR